MQALYPRIASDLQPDIPLLQNLTVPALYEHSMLRHEGILADGGALVALTAPYTGRSPQDKFIVREPTSDTSIWWSGTNRPISEDKFEALRSRLWGHLLGSDFFVQDVICGADPEYAIGARIITEYAWHSLFARNMFITSEHSSAFDPETGFTLICAPNFRADPLVDGTRSEVFVIIHLARRLVLIGGTGYAGEIKKSIFTVMNYVLPLQDVLSMHCSANVDPSGDVAIFFGLSGTGKTTLSADSRRTLIGDDEHGWSNDGVFNFESGCYAKVIRLSELAEPEIFATTRMFGTILENVVIDPSTRKLNLDDDRITENTRASYPLKFIENASKTGVAGHPKNIIFLTADAFGVLPPIAKLSVSQARYHFLSGYTAKVAGAERGVKEPQPNFSTCFAAPFLPLHPRIYSELLGERITKHKSQVWIVNTGWSGGSYGVGSRIKIAYTRAMIHAALTGLLDKVPVITDPIFGIQVPTYCPEVPENLLNSRNTWADKEGYDIQAKKLARMFAKNFEQFSDQVSPEVRAAGPRVE